MTPKIKVKPALAPTLIAVVQPSSVLVPRLTSGHIFSFLAGGTIIFPTVGVGLLVAGLRSKENHWQRENLCEALPPNWQRWAWRFALRAYFGVCEGLALFGVVSPLRADDMLSDPATGKALSTCS